MEPSSLAARSPEEDAVGQGLPTLYSEYIHQTRYARWSDENGRRETWSETVRRYVNFISKQAKDHGYEMTIDEFIFIESSIANTEAMCSMRALMTAGPAAERDNVALFNCCAVAVDDPRAFDESMYLLMCGCGVGFSVERQFISKLPEVPDQIFSIDDVIVVDDSRKSWAGSFRRLMAMLWAGHEPKWDLTRLRPAGARLKTFGGRSSGPLPLEELFRHTIDIFRYATGRRLTSLECHSIMCKIGDIVVSGGVRRSAMISLSNPSDDRMRDAKSGNWHRTDPHFAMANNSAVWTDKPDAGRFMREWLSLYESKSGERGIVNRQALRKQVEKTGRRDPNFEFMVNPCSEAILRPCGLCNLTEIVARATDTLDDLKRKAEAATIMGSIQATCTDFTYVRPIWKTNADEEMLLGVSITGEMDHPVLSKQDEISEMWKSEIKLVVIKTNQKWADKLGTNVSVATTLQKPSGTVSQLVNSASGGHSRHAPYYLRRTRDSKMDPIAEVVRIAGVPCEQDSWKPENWVFEWPIKAPEGSITTGDMTAIDQLERWLHTKRHWCEHTASATITVKENEWITVGSWVYEHFDEISGLSFLPAEDHVYTQAPFEEITKEEYEHRLSLMPKSIDWNMLAGIESEDNTTGSRELSCSAGQCEIDRPTA
jgi:ribonucleoside-diphosphate reductase alpha chain